MDPSEVCSHTSQLRVRLLSKDSRFSRVFHSHMTPRREWLFQRPSRFLELKQTEKLASSETSPPKLVGLRLHLLRPLKKRERRSRRSSSRPSKRRPPPRLRHLE